MPDIKRPTFTQVQREVTAYALALAVLVARRMGLRTVSEAPVLVAPRQPVYRFPSA